MKKIFFTPGPTQLYGSIPEYINEAIKNDICSISHRGKRFEEILQDTTSSLKKLLNVPNDFNVLFLSSATEAMERIIENCVEKSSFHLVNGAFSKRFFDMAVELKKSPQKIEVGNGQGFDFGKIQIPENAELVCFTQNETSTGAAIDMGNVYEIKRKNPEKLVAVDIVSSAPYVDVDYGLVDCTFFSVQKGFGLPAGLGVVIVNGEIMEKSNFLHNNNYNIGSYHSFLSLLKYSQKNQTPETPNVLGIYLLGKICNELSHIGIGKIRKETEEKAGIIYGFSEKHQKYKPFVKNNDFQSKTVIAIDTLEDTQKIIRKLEQNGFIVGSGYKEFKDKQIRIANFPMHNVEDVKKLLSYVE